MSDYKIFLSYARSDESIVKPIVQTLRDNNVGVFQDTDSIKPGENFEAKITESLISAEKVYVCWCFHASRSKWVEKEVELSIRENVRVIPLLMDNTPLPASLKDIEAIDYRKMVRHILTLKDIAIKTFAGIFTVATFLNVICVGLLGLVILDGLLSSSLMLGPKEPLDLRKALLGTLYIIMLVLAIAAVLAPVVSALWWFLEQKRAHHASRKFAEIFLKEIQES